MTMTSLQLMKQAGSPSVKWGGRGITPNIKEGQNATAVDLLGEYSNMFISGYLSKGNLKTNLS